MLLLHAVGCSYYINPSTPASVHCRDLYSSHVTSLCAVYAWVHFKFKTPFWAEVRIWSPTSL